MAKKTSEKAAKTGINKSEEIRKLAKEMQAKGEKIRPVVIVRGLKSKGIVVAPAQVSMVLKAMGFKRRKRRAGAGAGPVANKTNAKELSVSDLLKAKKMAEDFGGAVKLVNALSALVELR